MVTINKAGRLRRQWPSVPHNCLTWIIIRYFLTLKDFWVLASPQGACDNPLYLQLFCCVWSRWSYKPPTRCIVFCSATFYLYMNEKYCGFKDQAWEGESCERTLGGILWQRCSASMTKQSNRAQGAGGTHPVWRWVCSSLLLLLSRFRRVRLLATP